MRSRISSGVRPGYFASISRAIVRAMNGVSRRRSQGGAWTVFAADAGLSVGDP
jgi:hypothetical protein